MNSPWFFPSNLLKYVLYFVVCMYLQQNIYKKINNNIKMETEADVNVSFKDQERKHTNFENSSNTVSNTAIQISPKVLKTNVRKRKTKHFKGISKPAKEDFTLYLKKKFLKAFGEVGCTPETLALCLANYNVDADEVKEYFNKAAKEAQQYIHQECDSLSFNNINQWLKYMQTIGAPEGCNYETAIVINAIANNEELPEPETMGGINLKSIYKYLSNVLMGLPPPSLDPASAKFLSNEFKNLINEANTDNADIDVYNMKTKIETVLNTSDCLQPSSLDTLTISDDDLPENSTEIILKCINHVKIEK